MTTVLSSFSAQAQFATTQPPFPPNTVSVIQQEFSHDTAVLQFWADDVDSSSYASGMPMMLQWGVGTAHRIFYGYVNHAGRINNNLAQASGADRNSTVVYCVGASWPMKQPDTKSWANMTSSQIIQSIAAQFGLDALVVPTTTVWPTKQMAGKTYWQFCVCLAQEVGYTFYCNGIQLVFVPRQTDPTSLNGLEAVYDYRLNPAAMPIFTPVLGANSPAGGQLRNRQYTSIDPRTSQIIYSQVSGSPSPTTLGTTSDEPVFNETQHFTAHSQAEANTKTAGAGQLNQLYITASATAQGNAMISQGSLIYVTNANGAQNGLWFVEKVTHQLNTQTYQMQLSLGRDSRGAAAVVSIQPSTQSQPAARLVGTTWQAAA